jgi:hypothetical protein
MGLRSNEFIAAMPAPALFGNFAASIASRAKFARGRLPEQAAESRTNCNASLARTHAIVA